MAGAEVQTTSARNGNAQRVCEFLLAEARVALVAGDDFAAPKHIRMSYATSRENLARGFDAIERALATLG